MTSDQQRLLAGGFVAILFGAGAVHALLKEARLARQHAPMEACQNGDGQICDQLAEYELACEHHYALGCLHAGAALERTGGNDQPAMEDYEEACAAGIAEGCAAAERYCASPKASMGVKLEHFEKGCNANKLDACVALGQLYANANGNGLARDVSQATRLYRKACAGGNATACKLLQAIESSP